MLNIDHSNISYSYPIFERKQQHTNIVPNYYGINEPYIYPKYFYRDTFSYPHYDTIKQNIQMYLSNWDLNYELNTSDFPYITECFVNWRDINQYYCYSINDLDNNIDYTSFSKCSKRGNDKYIYKLRKKIFSLLNQLDNNKLRTNSDFKKSNVLYFTLTSTQEQYCSIENAWLNIGIDFNRFKSAIVRRFGKVAQIRCYEAFTKDKNTGYPHIHCIIVFQDYDFDIVKHTSTYRKHKGMITYRLKKHHLEHSYEQSITPIYNNKEYRALSDRSYLKSLWPSHMDIKAVVNLKDSISYLFKYILKDLDTASLSTVLNWYFHKRSFSLSNNFFDFVRLELNKSISNNFDKFIKDTNKICTFLGIFRLDFEERWHFKVDVPPDVYINSLKNEFLLSQHQVIPSTFEVITIKARDYMDY